MSKYLLITNIQRFSLHDGPGIRTTVFLKGCSLRCPWCANPENIRPEPERYVRDGREGVYGQWLSCEEVYSEVMKDRAFYGDGADISSALNAAGGVSFSGGEPLLQAEALEPLLERLNAEGIHLCVETALFMPGDLLELVIKYIDLFYVDIKILNEARCKEILHGDLKQYKRNVDALFRMDRPVIFRVPVIGGFTDDGQNQTDIVDFLRRYHPLRVELIKEHNLGESKYHSLGREPLSLNTVTDDAMMNFKQKIETATGIETEICKV